MGRTGAFISTHAEMERMKAETVVDLFQFIKAARTQRKGLVSNKVHYSYTTLSDNLVSHGHTPRKIRGIWICSGVDVLVCTFMGTLWAVKFSELYYCLWLAMVVVLHARTL